MGKCGLELGDTESHLAEGRGMVLTPSSSIQSSHVPQRFLVTAGLGTKLCSLTFSATSSHSVAVCLKCP